MSSLSGGVNVSLKGLKRRGDCRCQIECRRLHAAKKHERRPRVRDFERRQARRLLNDGQLVCNRLYPNLRKLEDRILAALRPWRTTATKVAALIGEGWLLDGANSGAPA